MFLCELGRPMIYILEHSSHVKENRLLLVDVTKTGKTGFIVVQLNRKVNLDL